MKREGDSGKIGGFARPSDGWHACQVTKDAGWALDEDKKRKDAVSVPLEVIDDEKEKGRRTWMYADLTDERGRKDFANFLLFLGIVDQLEKDKGIADVAKELSPQEWGNKFLNCKKKSVELINTALSRMPQKAILVEVISYDGKDKEGNKVRKQRVNEVKEYKKGAAKAEASKAEDGDSSGSSSESAPSSDWDE